MPKCSALYPLKFYPIFKDKIWGGKRISNILNKSAGNQCGESWEVSAISGCTSVVANGDLVNQSLTDLCEIYGTQLLGTSFNSFPLLIKFIDANEDLSIQVHPNDGQSNRQGKAEMWYVIAAEEGANLLCGFNQSTHITYVRDSIERGVFDELLNRFPVKAGDVFYIPSGIVHNIGKGILLAEIQQSSDLTFRMCDFDRVDDHGNKRELHLEQALAVLNFEKSTGKISNTLTNLVTCDVFTTNKIELHKPMPVRAAAGFKVFINVSGNARINFDTNQWSLNFGETCLLPVGLEMEIEPVGEVILLETYVDKGS